MNDAQIKHMGEQFLRWQLPENFNPDGGISFEPIGNKGNSTYEFKRRPSGTNLLDYTQAEAMVRHMLDGLPAKAETTMTSNLDPAALEAAKRILNQTQVPAGVMGGESAIFDLKDVQLCAETLVRLEGEPVGRKLAHDLTPEQADKLAFAVFYSPVTCAPQNIEAAVKEIDCCPGCESTSVSGSTCYKAERGEFCPNEVAETLRQIGFALHGPHDPSHYVPRERLGGSPLYATPAPNGGMSERDPPRRTAPRANTGEG